MIALHCGKASNTRNASREFGALRLYRLSLTTTARAVSAPRATPAALAPVLQGVATRTYKKFVADDGWPIASHIALSTLTSIFSFLIFVVGLAGFFGNRDIAQQAARLLLEAWPQSIAGPLTVEINNVITRPHGGLLGLGAMLSLFFASSSIEALRIGLDRAYDLKDERSWWQLRLQSILLCRTGRCGADSFRHAYHIRAVSLVDRAITRVASFGTA